MDVGFQMRGAQRVVIVDASTTGAEPGTVYRVPGRNSPTCPVAGPARIRSGGTTPSRSPGGHSARPARPTSRCSSSRSPRWSWVVNCRPRRRGHGAGNRHRRGGFSGSLEARGTDRVTVEITGDGYLRMAAVLAAGRFPSDALAAVPRDGELWLFPLRGLAAAGCCSSNAIRPETVRCWCVKCSRTVSRRGAPGVLGRRSPGLADIAGAVSTMIEDRSAPDRPKTAVRPDSSADDALDVQTVVVAERGQWAVDIVVVFADGWCASDQHLPRQSPRGIGGRSDQACRRTGRPRASARLRL